MPAKSRAQLRFLFSAEARGELPKGTAKRWAKHTPDIKALPEKKPVDQTRKEAAVRAIVLHLYKQGADGTTSPAAPMQNLTASQPAQPPTPRPADRIASEIGGLHPKHRSAATYARLKSKLPGSVRGFAAASQPTAKENFHASMGKSSSLAPLITGILRGCIDNNLGDDGFAIVMKKAAMRNDHVGADVRAFLDTCIADFQ
jgi:hypothetical protein